MHDIRQRLLSRTQTLLSTIASTTLPGNPKQKTERVDSLQTLRSVIL